MRTLPGNANVHEYEVILQSCKGHTRTFYKTDLYFLYLINTPDSSNMRTLHGNANVHEYEVILQSCFNVENRHNDITLRQIPNCLFVPHYTI